MWTIVVVSLLAAGTGGAATAVTTVPFEGTEADCGAAANKFQFSGSLTAGAPGNSYSVMAKCIETEKPKKLP